ncbi:MAG: hypothetical protein AAB525_03920 [Patescibacteria group bacterium]
MLKCLYKMSLMMMLLLLWTKKHAIGVEKLDFLPLSLYQTFIQAKKKH